MLRKFVSVPNHSEEIIRNSNSWKFLLYLCYFSDSGLWRTHSPALNYRVNWEDLALQNLQISKVRIEMLIMMKVDGSEPL